jgi:protein SCO1
MKYFLLIIVLLAGCREKQATLPYFNMPDFTPEFLTATAIANTPLHTIPTFRFTNQYGNIISNKTVAGKIYVVDFFFTRCTGICPRMTTNMSKVAAAFSDDNTVAILSHSVTPEHDSVAVLKRYADGKGITNPNWHLLTGDKKAVYNIARNGYFIEKAAGYNQDTSAFLHSENFVLVDQHQHIRGIYNGTLELETDQLIRHIRILQKEEQ